MTRVKELLDPTQGFASDTIPMELVDESLMADLVKCLAGKAVLCMFAYQPGGFYEIPPLHGELCLTRPFSTKPVRGHRGYDCCLYVSSNWML